MLSPLTAPRLRRFAVARAARRLATASLVAALLAAPAAEKVAAQAAAPVAGQGAARLAPGEADLQALLYYRRQGDEAASAAELRRLRRQFPEWTPPENPDALAPAGPGAAVDAIFRRIAEGDAAGARSGLAQTAARFAEWTPPPEMIRLLETLEAQIAFDAAIAARDLGEARTLAADNPDLRRCDRVNNVWRLADLQAKAGERAATLASHRGVVTACDDFTLVAASLEKSAASATAGDLEALFALAGPRFPDRTTELAALRTRLLAGMGAPTRTAPGARAAAATDIAADAAAQPGRAATVARRADGPARKASAGGLRRSGDPRIAKARAAAAREDWAACLAASVDPRSMDLLYQRGWCAYGHDRPLEALAAFRAAAAGGLDAAATRDAGFGMALAFLAEGMTDAAAEIAASVDLAPVQRRQVESGILDQRAVQAYEAGSYRSAIAFLDELERVQGGLRMDLSMLRSYAYLNLGDRRAALAQFSRLHQTMASDRTRAAMRAAAPTGGD